MIDTEDLSREAKLSLENQFPAQRERLYELIEHNCDELATYVREMANSERPDTGRKRFAIYGWMLRGLDYYRGWAKKVLIQRILQMERDDARAAAGLSTVAAPIRQIARTRPEPVINKPVAPAKHTPLKPFRKPVESKKKGDKVKPPNQVKEQPKVPEVA